MGISPDPMPGTRLPQAAGTWERRFGHATLFALTSLMSSGAVVLLARASAMGQAALLVHVACGCTVLPIACAYVVAHVRRAWQRDRGSSRTVGVATTAVTLVALATGAPLAVAYAANVFGVDGTAAAHRFFGVLALLVIPVHLATSRTRGAARALSYRPALLGVCATTIAGTALWAGILGEDPRRPVSGQYPRTADGGIFSASLVSTAHGGFVDARALTGSERCGTCHRQIFEEWSSSVHRFAGVDNALIATATRPAEEKGGVAAARFCASCHEPVALLSGDLVSSSFAISAETKQQGATCLVCHGIQSVPGLRGNGEMVYAPPDTFAFFNRTGAATDTANRLLVRSFVEEHRVRMRPPIMDNSHQCSSCHTVNASEALNGTGFIRLHNENDDWAVSAFSQGVGPQERVVGCRDCHMGREAGSTDPVAHRTGGTHRSHRFVAANTFVARHHGDGEQFRRTERFLRGEATPQEIRDLLPEGPPVVLELEVSSEAAPGDVLEISTVVYNRGVGHAFPAGPNEVNETWVELTVRDGNGREVFRSGALDEHGVRDPTAFALISIPVDAGGKEIFVTGGLSSGFRLRRAVLNGASDRELFRVPVPPDAAGDRLSLYARLRYRKADADFARLMEREGFSIADVPITDIAEARRDVSIVTRREDERTARQDLTDRRRGEF